MKWEFKNNHPNPQRLTMNEDSDLSIRKSPKPTLPNTIQSRFKDNPSQKQNQMRQMNLGTMNIQSQIEYLWENWHNFSSLSQSSTLTINHIIQNVECTHEDVILLFYLKQLSQTGTIRKKILNASLNIEFLELREADSKKLFLLKLLIDKLHKKLFFAVLTLKKYKKKLMEMQKMRNKNRVNTQKAQGLKRVLEHLSEKRKKYAMQCFKDSLQLFKLLVSQQEESKLYDNQFRKLQEHDDSLQIKEQQIYEKRIESQYFERNKDSVEHTQSEIVSTIRRFEEQLQRVQGKYMKREVKLKKIFLINWKIAFLRKNLQPISSDNSKVIQNHLNKQTNQNKNNNENEENNDNDEINQNNSQSLREVNIDKLKKLKTRMSRRSIRQSLKHIKQYSDSKRVEKYAEQIYKQNILKKALIGLRIERVESQSHFQLQEVSNEINQQGQELSEEQIQQYIQKSHRITNNLSNSSSDQLQQLSKQQELKANIFLKAHLQTKYYFILKNNLCITKLFKSIHRLALRKLFSSLRNINQEQAKLEERADRFRKGKEKVLVLRCFRGLKSLMYTNEGAEVYIQHKDKILIQNTFSILKLAWKQTLIKVKKIKMMVSHVEKQRAFTVIQRNMLPTMSSSIKRALLLKKRTLKTGKIFLKNLLVNCIQNKKKTRRVVFTRDRNMSSKTNLLAKCWNGWNQISQQRRQYKNALREYEQLKAFELKKRVFWNWMRLALLRRKALITSMEDSTSMRQQSMESMSSYRETLKLEHTSQDHRYWLQKYYENICAFDH